jgi:CheY-like chemotaxis protein
MSSGLRGVRVLILEDHEDSRLGYEALLSHQGARVLAAASAEEALEQVAGFQPDIIVSDLSLPRVDGFAFIRTLRRWPAERGGRCPAVALSGMGPTERATALADGYQAFVVKPADPQHLVNLLTELAQRGSH